MEFITGVVHFYAPHSRAAIYLMSATAAVVAIAVVYMRCKMRDNGRHLDNGWLVRTAAAASPIPIYILMIIAPLDADIIKAMMEDQVVVAIAGLYGLVETLKDIRFTGIRRH